jgi:hypothetical protein
MADIFLSYAREDRERAGQLAEALGAAGHDVFWDVEIPPGMTWADFLEEKLAACKAALVLWSKTSIASQWVREEARLARDRSKLIPVMLDDCAPPFGFGEIQAANLAHWRGDANDANFKLLVSAVDRAIGAPPRAAAPARPAFTPPTPPVAAPANKPISKKAWWIGGGVAVIAVLALIGSMEDDGGLAPVTPTPPVISPTAEMSAAVTQALEQARQIQAEAQAGAQQAAQAAAQAQQAAAQAQAGVAGFATTGAGANYVSGDLGSLQRGQPAAVVVQAPGNAFSGLVTMNTANGRYTKMVGANQAANGLGSQAVTTFSSDAASGRMVGRYFAPGYSAEGSSEGVLTAMNFTGVGVVQYADGSRYAGQYRIVGAESRIVKQGHGAVYASNGAVTQAGRFENDVYAGPN